VWLLKLRKLRYDVNQPSEFSFCVESPLCVEFSAQ
jgi:hypothetical protein